MNNKIVEAVTNWFLWTVGIASIPIILKVLLDFILQRNPIHINEELLLVSAIITGHSIGKGFRSNVRSFLMTVTVWACLMTAIISAFWFATISILEIINISQHPIYPLIMLFIAIVASSCCIAHTET